MCLIAIACSWMFDHWKLISGASVAILVILVLVSPMSMIITIPSFSFLTRRKMDSAVRHVFNEAVEQRMEKQFFDRVVEEVSGRADGSSQRLR